MRKMIVATLMAGVALPAYAADLALSGGYVAPQDPVLAPTPMVVGHLNIGAGYFDTSFEDFSFDGGLFQGAGRANIDLGGFNIEFETGGNALIEDGNSLSTIGAAAHLWGKFNNAALGVFGAANFPSFGSVYTAGVEGEVYFGAITLGADATYNWADGGISEDYWTVRGWADWYLTPDARIGAQVAYVDYDSIGPLDPNKWIASIDGEYRFSGSPLSLWGEVNYSSSDLGFGIDPETWSGMIGLRVFMDGGMTLHEHDMYVPWDGGTYDGTRSTVPWWFL